MADRAAEIADFLAGAGWGEARRAALAGDASTRRYERLRRAGGQTAILMDAPARQGQDIGTFLRIAAYLNRAGLSAPETLAADPPRGLALIEDFGDGVFARIMAAEPEREMALYDCAVDVLAELQAAEPPEGLPAPSPADLAAMIEPAREWYAGRLGGEVDGAVWAGIETAFAEILAEVLTAPRVMALRDYHAENLIWLPGRAGVRRAGLLDFQDAFLGDPVYDLVSLLQDARRDPGPGIEDAMKRRFQPVSGYSAERFETVYAALGAQRNLRILGVFARLSLKLGKPGYVRLIPRVWGHLMRDLEAPGLRGVARLLRPVLPEPAPDVLNRLRPECDPALTR